MLDVLPQVEAPAEPPGGKAGSSPHPPLIFLCTVMSSIVPQDSLYYFENLVVFFVQSPKIGCFVGMLCANTRHLQQQLLEKNHTLILLNNLAPPSPLSPLINPHAPPLGTRYMSCWFSMPYQQILLFSPIGTEFLTFV